MQLYAASSAVALPVYAGKPGDLPIEPGTKQWRIERRNARKILESARDLVQERVQDLKEKAALAQQVCRTAAYALLIPFMKFNKGCLISIMHGVRVLIVVSSGPLCWLADGRQPWTRRARCFGRVWASCHCQFTKARAVSGRMAPA